MQECSICLLHLSSLESLVNLVHMFCLLVYLFSFSFRWGYTKVLLDNRFPKFSSSFLVKYSSLRESHAPDDHVIIYAHKLRQKLFI